MCELAEFLHNRGTARIAAYCVDHWDSTCYCVIIVGGCSVQWWSLATFISLVSRIWEADVMIFQDLVKDIEILSHNT